MSIVAFCGFCTSTSREDTCLINYRRFLSKVCSKATMAQLALPFSKILGHKHMVQSLWIFVEP